MKKFNQIELKEQTCGRSGEDFLRHPHLRKQKYFYFWPKIRIGHINVNFLSEANFIFLWKRLMVILVYYLSQKEVLMTVLKLKILY